MKVTFDHIYRELYIEYCGQSGQQIALEETPLNKQDDSQAQKFSIALHTCLGSIDILFITIPTFWNEGI